MLFELAVAAGEQLLVGNSGVDWETCLSTAVSRQRHHFDAVIPTSLADADKNAAAMVGANLATMLLSVKSPESTIVRSPTIPGYQWISSGVGDFSIDSLLIEVKCSSRVFSTADYRQIAMYWLLSYAAAIDQGTPEWTGAMLVNPRLNVMVQVHYNEFIGLVGAGRSKVEILEILQSLTGDESTRLVGSA